MMEYTVEKIPEDGIYFDVPEEVYHAWPLVNYTNLKILTAGGTPARYKAATEEPADQSDAMKFGTLVDQALTEPKQFENKFENKKELPLGITRRGEKWKQLQADNPDIEWFTSSEWQKLLKEREKVMRIKDSLLSHSIASELMRECPRQAVLIWTDPDFDVRIKARLDFMHPDYTADLKTTAYTDIYTFHRKAYWNFRYHIQASMYTDGRSVLEKRDVDNPKPFWFIVVEKVPPFEVTVHNGLSCIDENKEHEREAYGYLTFGRAQYKDALRIVKSCEESGVWPGHPDDVFDMLIPKGAGFEGLTGLSELKSNWSW